MSNSSGATAPNASTGSLSSRKRLVALASAALTVPLLATLVAATPASAAGSGPSTRAFSSAMLRTGSLPAKSWLGGKGVRVIRSRQCGELAVRLYSKKGWGAVRSSRTGGSESIPEGSPSLRFHRNGRGYLPVPGDIVVEKGGNRRYGHVAVVDRVVGKRIITVEQNANPSGWHVYRFRGKTAVGAYNGRFVRGFVHSPKNHLQNP